MRFLTYNIQYGLGRDGRSDIGRIADEVRGADADVIALQEVERHWPRSGDLDQSAELARRLNGYHWVYGASLDVHAGTRGEPSRRRQFGNMLLAKMPILSARNHLLPKFGALDQHSIQRAALEGVITTARGPLRIYSVHLDHLVAETRLPQVERLLEAHTNAYREGGAWCGHHDPAAGWTVDGMPPMPREAVIMGDFNCTPDSREYTRLIGPWSERFGRFVNRDGLVDAWVAAGHDERSGATHPDDGRIDYVLVSAELRLTVRAARILIEAEGSDHWPVVAELDL